MLAVIGLLALVLLGINLFSQTREEVAWRTYVKRKKELEEERKQLDASNAADAQRIAEIESDIQGWKKEVLKKTASTKEELKQIDVMSAEEVANETTRREQSLRDRLGLDL